MGGWGKNGSSRGGSARQGKLRLRGHWFGAWWSTDAWWKDRHARAGPNALDAARPKCNRQNRIYGPLRPATGIRAGRYHSGNAAAAARLLLIGCIHRAGATAAAWVAPRIH